MVQLIRMSFEGSHDESASRDSFGRVIAGTKAACADIVRQAVQAKIEQARTAGDKRLARYTEQLGDSIRTAILELPSDYAGCPYCGAFPQPLHDELPIPVCCMRAQREAIYGRSSEDVDSINAA